ncbi:N-acetylglucosamine-6-phosphate deacetylase [Entomortierella parvispora]|uniref:N-acetylglucosamine-6-phosphate deacetylase n=1 Tax=Entomortierella parvispora TaxID=205924 RepID=A0A9P3HI48_9FUNG|nr:N-acetylglucosamine-6-phosphate deacetylase [Entomortierella parvispora]
MQYPVALQTHNFSTAPASPQPASLENEAKVTKITNCKILRDHQIVEHDAIWIQGDKIIDPHKFFWYQKRLPDLVLDAGGLLVVPGFIEVQINGAFGFDFSIASDPETYEQGLSKVSRGLVKYGTTSYCPTVVSSTASDYNKILPHLKPRSGSALAGASILGAHVEGPFINESRAGSHSLDALRTSAKNGLADIKDVYGLDEDSSSEIESIKLFTCAPELEGVADCIPNLVKAGITVSIGHSTANISQAEKAVTNGATFIAHLFNAMPQFHHRDPGVIGLLGSRMDLPRPYYGLICDGMHVHPNSVKIAYDSHPEGVILCTAMSPLGLEQEDEDVQLNAINTPLAEASLEAGPEISSTFNKANGLRIDLDKKSRPTSGIEQNKGSLPTPPGSTPLSPLKMTVTSPSFEGVDASIVAAEVQKQLLPPQMLQSSSFESHDVPWVIKTVYAHSQEYDEHDAFTESATAFLSSPGESFLVPATISAADVASTMIAATASSNNDHSLQQDVEMTDCRCKHHVQHVIGSDRGSQKSPKEASSSSSPSVRTQRSEAGDLCCASSSVITMDACIRNFIEFTSCSVIEALEAVTLHPAVMLGIQNSKGVIQPGADADLVFLSEDLFVKRVFVAGEEVMDL